MKVLKKILFVVAFFTVTASVSAQVNFGVKAGLNTSTLNGAEDADYKAGFHAGVMVQGMMTENFGLESGLYYSMLGAKSSTSKEEANPSYIQLPVMALYKFRVGEGLSLYPSAGLYLGYGIGGKSKSEYEGLKVETDFFGKINGEETTNRFDVGATVGLNLQYNKVVIGLGYDHGLMKINKKSVPNMDDIFNSNIKVSVGYFF